MKSFWNLSLIKKIRVFQYWCETYLMPPKLVNSRFSWQKARRFAEIWTRCCHYDMCEVTANRDYQIRIGGSRRNIPNTLLGETITFRYSSIVLGVNSIKNMVKNAYKNEVKVIADMTYDQLMWTTLLHEMAHAGAVIRQNNEDHGIPFVFRLFRVYLFAWWHSYFGVLR